MRLPALFTVKGTGVRRQCSAAIPGPAIEVTDVMRESEIREKIQNLLILASEGTLSMEDLIAVNGQLEMVGYSSLNYMAFLSGLEQELGISVDPFEEPDFLASVDTITEYVRKQLEVPN
jgi:acyl carrier protein